MTTYSLRYVSAPWIKCDVCKGPATGNLQLHAQGRYGRKGSRSLGFYCDAHGRERLDKLRAKRRRL